MKSLKAALLGGLVGLSGFCAEAEELIAYYKAGYIGDHASSATDALKLTATSDGAALSYTRAHGTWTLIIDENSPSGAQAWCATDVKYNDFAFNIAKVIIKRNFTLKPGVATALFDQVEIEVEEGVKLTLTNEGSRNMSLGAVTFSGDGEVDASSGVAFTQPITTKGNVTVKTPDNTFVANVDGTDYLTLQAAFDAAKLSGTILLLKPIASITSVPADLMKAAEWQGTLVLQEMDDTLTTASYKYDLQTLGNTSSRICFNGYKNYPCAPTSVSSVGRDVSVGSWVIGEKGAEFWGQFGDFGFNYVGNLEGNGLLRISNTGNSSGARNYVRFKGDPSGFAGSIDMTGSTYRLILAPSNAGAAEQWSAILSEFPMIHVLGVTAQVAKDQTWTAKTIKIDGTIGGSGTLAGNVVFGNTAAIDLTDGVLTVNAANTVTFGSTLTLKNVQPGDTILECASKPTNLETVTLKDATGAEKLFWKLSYTDGQVVFSDGTKKLNRAEQWTVTAAELSSVVGGEKVCLDLRDYLALDQSPVIFPTGTSAADVETFLSNLTVVAPVIRPNASLSVQDGALAISYEPMTLYWAAWRGTFWEHIGQTDVNGNHGLMRDEAGNINIAHRPNDTVIFDKAHYQVAGEFAEQSPYWHYDENLYIKQQVLPGASNEWDMKILEGVKLKLGFCGARTTGQNIIRDFKIYVEENSTLELGYWGNTHHYQGVIRPDVTFGGAGMITLGDDMGASCRVEGDLKVKQDPSAQETEIPALNVHGKELVVQGGQIDVNLTGFGALSGSGTITTPIEFENATINATDAKGFTFKNTTTFTGTLTVDLTSAPTGKDLVKICTKGEGGSFVFDEGIDVLVRVNGSVQPAFYTLALNDAGDLCVKVAPTTIEYGATVRLGYDYKTMICRVTMTPAIEGVVATVTVNGVDENLKTWTAPVIGMRGSGRCEVMVGDADDNFAPGAYSMTVSVGEWHKDLEFTLAIGNDGNLATVGGVGYTSMREAVAAGGTIELLTNVFFAAPEGTYAITRNGFDVKTTNYTTIDAQTNKVTAEDEVVFERDGEGIARVVIAGDWLAAGLPWRSKKAIDAAIWTKAETMAPFEAYVLGFDAEDALTAKVIARGVQTADPNTIELTDRLTIKPSEKTGVVVTKKLVDTETKREVSATTVYDLSQMGEKAKLLRIGYSFAPDSGQK